MLLNVFEIRRSVDSVLNLVFPFSELCSWFRKLTQTCSCSWAKNPKRRLACSSGGLERNFLRAILVSQNVELDERAKEGG